MKEIPICDKLLAVESVTEWGNEPDAPHTCWHRNPDGPEAAAIIRRYHDTLSVLVEALNGEGTTVAQALGIATQLLSEAQNA